MIYKKIIYILLFVMISTVCSAHETDGYFCVSEGTNATATALTTPQTQKRDTIKTRTTRFLHLGKDKGKDKDKNKTTKDKAGKDKKPAQQQNHGAIKQLPSEFPKNYHQEVEAYYARQKFHEKALRKLINTRNYVSFSTNMAFDAVLIPNIAAEFSITPQISLSASWMHSWWTIKSQNFFWRVYGGDITARYWFGKKSKTRRLTGHHIGIYGQALSYDLDLGGQAQMTDGWNYAAGIEYGHSFIISKNFNIDVYAGVGFLTGNYKDYENKDGHYVWQVSVQRSTILPTKIGASLVWILPIKKKSILYED